LALLLARTGARGLWLAPAAWVTGEYLRGTLLSGFPWVPLGDSQIEMLAIAQAASVVGVYGMSLIVASVNARHRLRPDGGGTPAPSSRSRARRSRSSASPPGERGGWPMARSRVTARRSGSG
jgi:apolipoprotein N-acyltransferase